MSDEGTVADLLAERPDLEEPLEAVLEVDQREDTWTFDDLPIDSGPFGELVSRGVVESVDEGYRLADPSATERALDGESTSATNTGPYSTPTLPDLPSIDSTTTGFVALALAVVALVRVHSIASIYPNGDVVLSGNDPYYYRYWVEQVATAGGVTDFSGLATLPDAVQKGEPLMVATLWWLAELLGGSVAAIGHVLAWYPIVSAVLTAGVVYLLTVKLTADRRAGLAGVLLFAIIPGHAMRTSLGFADHHAFDYPWLALTGLCLVVLVGIDREDLRTIGPWLASIGLGVAVAGQVLAWEAGPLLIAPVGLAVVASTLTAVYRDRSPLAAGIPTVVGLALATLLAGGIHLAVGWHTPEVAFSPGVVLLGSTFVLALAEGVHRTSGDVRHLIGIDAAAGIAGVATAIFFLPQSWGVFIDRLDSLFRDDVIAETIGLFNIESFGFFLLMGFTLVLALPVMVAALARARKDARWGVAAVYAWYFLLLAAIQVRFVGELATFAAVFAGIGFVWVAAWIDVIPGTDFRRRVLEPLRVPDRGTILTLGLLFLLVGSLGILQVPVKTSQVTVSDDLYETASFIEERADELGQEYPENYVLSDWGDNRKYNYFVNGESQNYGYARQHYEEFASGTDPDSWYSRFEGRVGYVVMATASPDASPQLTISKLTREFGSATESIDGVGHFRAIYRSPGGTRTAFAVVSGADLRGEADANATVSVSTDVEIPNTRFTYERQSRVNSTGTWSATVAQPGTYTVRGDGVNATVAVSAAAVRTGETIAVRPD